MLLNADESQLVLIDYQPQLMEAMHDADHVLLNALRLAQAARLLHVPIWGTEQNPKKLGDLVPSLRSLCGNTLEKMRFSAGAEGLLELLRPPARAASHDEIASRGNARSLPKHLQKSVQSIPKQPQANMIVLAGCEAHICLMQTALELLDEEFDVVVVTDACSARSERNRDAAFDRLAGAGVELVTTEMVLFEWLESAEHPLFKQIQALIK